MNVAIQRTSDKATNRRGQRSFAFPQRPPLKSTFTVAGPLEGKGPLGQHFDTVLTDTYYGERCWEKAESKMLKEALKNCIERGLGHEKAVGLVFTGDLLNQCIAGSFAVKDLSVPHLGVYSACASFAEGLILACMAMEGGFCSSAAVGVSSHHDGAERQFRFPTELGVQRPPTAQWTTTLAAAALLDLGGDDDASSNSSKGPWIRITGATVGEVIEMGIKDPYNMGTAMAPAAVDTILTHFQDFNLRPDDYDLIITGDLGKVGSAIACDLMASRGYPVADRFDDCGLRLYQVGTPDIHSGASGTACSAGVFCAYIVKGMQRGKWKRVLFAPTGALYSPVSYKQGEPIPAICHAVALEVSG